MFTTRPIKTLAIIAFAVIVALTGCSGDSDDTASPTTSTPIPEDICKEVANRQTAAEATHLREISDAEANWNQAITDVEDPADLADATKAANEDLLAATMEANDKRDSTLEALEADADWCAEQSFPNPFNNPTTQS